MKEGVFLFVRLSYICSVHFFIFNHEGIIDGPVEHIHNGTTTVRREGNLRGKIGGLTEKALLTKKHSEILHEHRFLGNDALHSLDALAKYELKLAIEIIEHTLDNLYEISQISAELRWRRRKKNSTSNDEP